MIESSFCFLPGVGLRTDRRFWREGVVTWEDFLNTQSLPRISGVRKSRFDEDIAQARDHFARQDVRYFARTVPARPPISSGLFPIASPRGGRKTWCRSRESGYGTKSAQVLDSRPPPDLFS